MLGKLAVVHWNDPSFEKEVSNISGMDFVKQVNVGWVTFIGEKVLIVNAVTDGDTFEVTLIHKALVTRIKPLEVQDNGEKPSRND